MLANILQIVFHSSQREAKRWVGTATSLAMLLRVQAGFPTCSHADRWAGLAKVALPKDGWQIVFLCRAHTANMEPWEGQLPIRQRL